MAGDPGVVVFVEVDVCAQPVRFAGVLLSACWANADIAKVVTIIREMIQSLRVSLPLVTVLLSRYVGILSALVAFTRLWLACRNDRHRNIDR